MAFVRVAVVVRKKYLFVRLIVLVVFVLIMELNMDVVALLLSTTSTVRAVVKKESELIFSAGYLLCRSTSQVFKIQESNLPMNWVCHKTNTPSHNDRCILPESLKPAMLQA